MVPSRILDPRQFFSHLESVLKTELRVTVHSEHIPNYHEYWELDLVGHT